MFNGIKSKIFYFIVHLAIMAFIICFVAIGGVTAKWFFRGLGIASAIFAVFNFANNVFFHTEFIGEFFGIEVSYEETNIYSELGSMVFSLVVALIIYRLPDTLGINGFFITFMIYIFSALLGIKLAKENQRADFYHESTAILGDYVPFVYMVMGTLILVFSTLGFKPWISIVLISLAGAFHLFRVIKAYVEER